MLSSIIRQSLRFRAVVVVGAALVMVNLPFAMIGGIIALYFSGLPISLGALVGMVILGGLISSTVLNLLLLPALALKFGRFGSSEPTTGVAVCWQVE